MNELLKGPIANRVTSGESKESIKKAVLESGYSSDEFEQTYAEVTTEKNTSTSLKSAGQSKVAVIVGFVAFIIVVLGSITYFMLSSQDNFFQQKTNESELLTAETSAERLESTQMSEVETNPQTLATENTQQQATLPEVGTETGYINPPVTEEDAKETSLVTPLNSTPSEELQFSVKKVDSDYIYSFFQMEKTLDISLTTYSDSLDPNTLSICMTLTDENNIAFTETDCWPLEQFGTFSHMADGDLNLAPLEPSPALSWEEGLHPIKIRFEIVQGLIGDYSNPMARSRYELLASDDTGIFNLKLEQDPDTTDIRN